MLAWLKIDMSFLPSPEEIRRMRLRIGLTQKELAERAGVSQSLIARIENGSVDPRLSTLRRILKALEEAAKDKVKARDVMHSPVISVEVNENVGKAAELMWKYGISQIPVLKDGRLVGTILEDSIVRAMLSNPHENVSSWPVKRIMNEVLPIVSPQEDIETIMQILTKEPAVLVMKAGRIIGIITKSDIIAYKVVRKERSRSATLTFEKQV